MIRSLAATVGSQSVQSVSLLGSDAKVKFHLDANYAQATQTFDQFATKADSSFIMNGRISLADVRIGEGGQKFTIGLWGRNILNEQHVYR